MCQFGFSRKQVSRQTWNCKRYIAHNICEKERGEECVGKASDPTAGLASVKGRRESSSTLGKNGGPGTAALLSQGLEAPSLHSRHLPEVAAPVRRPCPFSLLTPGL